MCWYSQHERLNTRRAIEGEELMIRDFPYHGQWLVSPEDVETPVCIPNGCMLRISNIPKNLQKELKLESEAVAEFREIYQSSPKSWLAKIFLPPRLCFDVALFANGNSLEISMFAPDMKVDILSPAVVAPVGHSREETERMYV